MPPNIRFEPIPGTIPICAQPDNRQTLRVENRYNWKEKSFNKGKYNPTALKEGVMNCNEENQWKKIYFLGGCATLIVFALTLFDITIGIIISKDLTLLPQTAIERFLEFKGNWLIGLYHLDMLNVLISVIMIPIFFAIYAAHREIEKAIASLVLIFFIIGTVIFISTNTALPMLELSGKYSSTINEMQKGFYIAAGEALLVRGEHGSPGVFIGFILLSFSNILVSIVMIKARKFDIKIGVIGIIGNFSLMTYIVLVTFFPTIKNVAIQIAAPGGILVLAWYLLVAKKLIKLGLEK
jgi:hypothetical protein